MSDSGTTDGFTTDLLGGAAEVDLTPVGGGEVALAVRYDGDTVEQGGFPKEVFTKPTPKGQFLNSTEEAFEQKPGIDAEAVRQELKEWCAEMAQIGREEETKMLPGDVQRIIDGTELPVEVYNGEPTTWHIELTFAGKTEELEFTAGEMIGASGKPLEQKIANEFFEKVDVEAEDWDKITERWMDNQTVVHESNESQNDAIANRVVDHIAEGLIAVGDRDQVTNDTAAVWFDEDNDGDAGQGDIDGPVVWVQDRYLVDQLETAGKSVGYKGQFVKDAVSRGDMAASSMSKRWLDGPGIDKFYPFEPETLGVSADDVTAETDGDNDDEVDV